MRAVDFAKHDPLHVPNMDAKLVIVGGKANKREVLLNLPTIIGRSREAGLTIAHPMVSRQHCELYEDNGLLMVRDLGSLNGTFLHKERITEAARLLPNDEFTIGPLTFRAEYDYAGEIAIAPTAPEQPPDFPALPGEPEDTAERQGAVEQPWAVERPPAGAEAGPQFPDFSAWDQAHAAQAAGSVTPPTQSPAYPDEQFPSPSGEAACGGPAASTPAPPELSPAKSPGQPQGAFSLGPVAPDQVLPAPAASPPVSQPAKQGDQPPAKAPKRADEDEEMEEFFKNLF